MAEVIIQFKIMPTSPEVDMDSLKEKVVSLVSNEGKILKSEIEPIAFGLKALNIYAIMDESKGSPDELISKIESLDNVESAEIASVSRA